MSYLYSVRSDLYLEVLWTKQSNSLGLHAQQATDLKAVKGGKNIPLHKNGPC